MTLRAKRPAAGDRIRERYRVVDVADGSRGPVATAVDEELDRRVVLEMLEIAETDEGAVERFRSEAKVLAKLESEHAARLLDVGSQDGWFYVAREHLDGQSLTERIGEPVPLEEAALLVVQASEVVAEANANGVVLRALEPEHFVVTRPLGGAPRIKLVDFGTAKLLRDPGAGVDVTVSAAIGVSPYASPELVRRASHLDARTDVWSLGAILYALVCGRPPFEGDTADLMLSILKEPHVPAAKRVGALPRALDENVLKWALAKDVDGRFRDLFAFAHALAAFAPPSASAIVDRIKVLKGRARKPPAVRPALDSAPKHAPAPAPKVETASNEEELSETRIDPLQPRGEARVSSPVFAGAAADIRPTPLPPAPDDEETTELAAAMPFIPPPPRMPSTPPSVIVSPKARAPEPAAARTSSIPPPPPRSIPPLPPVPGDAAVRASTPPPSSPSIPPPPPEAGGGPPRVAVASMAPSRPRAAGRPTPAWVYAAAGICVATPTALAMILLARPRSDQALPAASAPQPERATPPPAAPPAIEVVGPAASTATTAAPTSEPGRPAQRPTGPVGATGTIVAVAVGGTCTFSVDGAVRGRGATLKVVVPVGQHLVTCQPAGGAPKSRSVNIRAGDASMTTFKLQ